MPFIQNIALYDLTIDYFKNPGDNAVLIQILDNDMENWPVSKHQFKEIHRFKFLDVEEHQLVNENFTKISDEQANDIANILTKALDRDMNVIVHCHAGVCRSGAVCEVGVMMGFEDTHRFRSPNLFVKKKILKALGMYPYEDEGL